MEKDNCEKTVRKQAIIAIFIPDQMYFQLQLVIKDNEGHFILAMSIIQLEVITIKSIYAMNVCVSSAVNTSKQEAPD